MDPQYQTSTTDFPVVSYRQLGAGPALMLLHGFPANGSLWNDVAQELSKNFTLLIPDLPGTGRSTPGNSKLRIAQLAGIVPAILDRSGIGDCVLAGHSMGGYVALAAMAAFPGRLRGVSLVHSTAAADDEAKKEKRAKSIALINNGGREPFIRGMVPGLFAPGFPESNPAVISEWIEEGLKIPAATLTAFYQAMMDRPDRIGELSAAPVPLQFIVGAEDSTIPWQAVLHQSVLPDVSFVERYPATGHMGMIEQPDRMGMDLKFFVNYCQ